MPPSGASNLDNQHVGTGFVVGPGLILTNRHVLQGLAAQETSGAWTFLGTPSITFDAAPHESRTRQFTIRQKVVACGPTAIDPELLDLKKLDFAVLECDIPTGAPHFPAPLPLENDADKITEGRSIYTIGYPAEPPVGWYDDDVLARLFRRRFGVKRFAPGKIARALGTKASGETVFTHDATTLAGNSGSCVVDFGNDGQLVGGLHFAGRAGTENYAHSNAKLQTALAGVKVTWKAWLPG